jgi:1-aminocyclopropane-1-carboxylate deaminase/D-cysteine desulfhydrase-like pyridoxal-dependent ACC family enzyme
LITAGAIQSNHCRQTAAAAARFGMRCTLVLSGEPPAQLTGNLLLDNLFGAEIVWTDREARDATLQYTYQRAVDEGQKPFLIPYGGSSPTGATAYVYAIKELLDQEYYPDWIVFPSSSGGTHAGLVLGAHLFGYRGEVLGISVDEPEDNLKSKVAQLATETAELLGESVSFRPQDIRVDAGYLGGGYGVMGPGEREAIQQFARLEGLILDPVYTGRAAAGMIDRIRKGVFPQDSAILFWHTGGGPAVFAEKYRSLV